MDEVDLVLRKYDGRLHRWVTGRRLGEDEHGVWLGTPTGTTVHYNYGRKATRTTSNDAVRLIPHDAWWIAMFSPVTARRDLYCDICLPPVWTTPVQVTVVDLDIDLRRVHGRVELEDEDEFAAHTISYGYPPEVVAGATTAAAELRRAVVARDEPFATAAHRWLALLKP